MEPSAFFAQPMATPTAKSSGRLSNSAPPPAAKIAASQSSTVMFSQRPSMSSWPRRSSSAAAGRTAMGSMRLRPSFCRFFIAADFFFGDRKSVV